MRTFSPKVGDIERRWYVVDADGAPLGRLASEVAKVLRGKHKPIFAPHVDTGDHVVVVNAGRVRLTGGKEQKKVYYRHSGYPGGLREIPYASLLANRPVLAVEKAIKGMLPKNRLGRQIASKLSVYEGPEHPHRAQKPVALSLGQVPPWEGLPASKPSRGVNRTSRRREPDAVEKERRAPASESKAATEETTIRKGTTRKGTTRGAGAARRGRNRKKES